jgi:hypothetical protein
MSFDIFSGGPEVYILGYNAVSWGKRIQLTLNATLYPIRTEPSN